MNIFEGARRIATIGAGLIILASAVGIYGDNPHVVLTYRVMFLGAAPLQVDICNEAVDATRTKEHTTANGRKFYLRTCFRASKADDGRMLIPYAEAPDNMVYLGHEYSDEVRRYTETISEGIVPTDADIKEADSEYLRQAWTKRLQDTGLLIAGLAVYWMIIWAVGWIVRGFLSIPRGQDYRIVPAAPQ